MPKITLLILFVVLFAGASHGQSNKKLNFIISSHILHVSSFGQNQHVEFDNSAWLGAEASIAYQLNNGELQLGASYHSYKRTIHDYLIDIECGLRPDQEFDPKTSGVSYGSDRTYIGIPLSYVLNMSKKEKKLGLKIGFEPRFKLNETGTHGFKVCGAPDPFRPSVEYYSKSIGSLYFAKIGLLYQIDLGQHVKILVQPLVEFLLNNEKYQGLPMYSTPEPITNRIVNIGISIGLRL